MKHHFGDFLDREGGYWTIVPNVDRYAYSLGEVPAGSKQITIVTISKDETHWERIFSLPNLEELTLHEPNKEQIASISNLTGLKRLRITHARPRDLDFLSGFVNVEELVLEYVSGFTDLSTLRRLRRLRSLHLENLRRVTDFKGLSDIESLRYLHIDGTFDWKQPIADFEFLNGLQNLEVFSLGQVITKATYPALLPLVKLSNLKKIRIPLNMLPIEEYALMEVGLPNVAGTRREVCTIFASTMEVPNNDIRAHLSSDLIRDKHPEVAIWHDGRRMINDAETEWYEFLGKGSGHIKRRSPNAESKCNEHRTLYAQMKERAKKLIRGSNEI